MKDIIIIKQGETVVFEGKLYDMPFKEEAIKNMSIKLFSDPEPCIIHQTYAMQTLLEPLMKQLKMHKIVNLNDIDTSYLNLSNIETLTIEKKRF